MIARMERSVVLSPDLPEVCRFGLATRGGSGLRAGDVEAALERGMNYWNWCGHADGMSRAASRLGARRAEVVIAAQLEARTLAEAESGLAELLNALTTDYLDIVTLYYVESQAEWETICGPAGAMEYLRKRKQEGVVRLIGLTSHQRKLAAQWAGTGLLDMLMIRYNAAHRGAETDIFPAAAEAGIPVVTFTGLRWRELLRPTPADPPGFNPSAAAQWYRFCLAHPSVAVALTAPGNRDELEENFDVLEDWQAPGDAQMRSLREHGDRVHRHAGEFW
jgi:predicted aldo/keto reductase-like oxidoreductase